ncbi:hypothetical protein GGQ72_002322 [Rhizobium rhizoryzae]|uniref:Uncharacterized protein n=1 Tax=Rhizobium rhizoryzae TaxID=451876 RepID=A0A7W6PQ50_9HYPH|nr:hypothetical protein [Rhizobium rhizoryzae]
MADVMRIASAEEGARLDEAHAKTPGMPGGIKAQTRLSCLVSGDTAGSASSAGRPGHDH